MDRKASTLARRGKEYLETVADPLRGERKIKLSVKDAQPNKVSLQGVRSHL